MKNSITKLLKNTWGLLIFALLSGCAYYAVILKFILSNTKLGGGLLGLFLLPLIICGAALVLIKLIKQCFENGREGSAVFIFWIHILFMIIGAVFAVSVFM